VLFERLLAAAGIFLAANFCMSYIVPAPAGWPAWLLFPFGRTDAVNTWTFGRIDGFGLVLMLGLAGVAVLSFIGAFLATFGWWLSADWWPTLVLVGAGCSAALFLLHLGPWAIAPLILDAVLLWIAWAGVWLPEAAP
jgi:hypothetical protein